MFLLLACVDTPLPAHMAHEECSTGEVATAWTAVSSLGFSAEELWTELAPPLLYTLTWERAGTPPNDPELTATLTPDTDSARVVTSTGDGCSDAFGTLGDVPPYLEVEAAAEFSTPPRSPRQACVPAC